MTLKKNVPSDSLKGIPDAVIQIAKERNWRKFQTQKNMAMNLVRESSEAMEHLIWV